MPDLFPSGSVIEFLRENSGAVLPAVHLIIWGSMLLCLDPFLEGPQKKTGSLLMSLLGLLMSGIQLALTWENGAGPAFFDTIVLDSFARYFDVLFLAAATLAVLISYRHLDVEGSQHSEYYALLLFATSGMMFMAGALDLVTIFVGLELMSISTYVLVGFLRRQRRSNEASLKYFLLGAFSTGIILYGMSLLYGISGSTYLTEIARSVTASGPSSLAVLGILLMMAGLCFKIAAAPFHMWVPDVYEGAPTGITAFMSVAVKAAAFSVFFRVFYVAFGDAREVYVWVLAVIAMVTMTWGNVAAVTQKNVKRLLAYSSISHAGYVLMGLVAGTDLGVTSSAVYLLIYTFMNLGVWSVLILLRRADISGEELEDFNGLFFKQPGVAVLMLLFLLSLAGIPPLGGFIAKYFVFAAVIQSGLAAPGGEGTLLICLALVGALNAVVALYYYLRIVVAMFLQVDYVAARLSFSLGVAITLFVTITLTILMGVYPQPFIELARSASLPLI